MKILLISDDYKLRTTVREAFERMLDAKVSSRSESKDIDKFEEFNFDIVISDFLPNSHELAYDVLKKVRERSSSPYLIWTYYNIPTIEKELELLKIENAFVVSKSLTASMLVDIAHALAQVREHSETRNDTGSDPSQ